MTAVRSAVSLAVLALLVLPSSLRAGPPPVELRVERPSSAPEEIERTVLRPLELALEGIDGVGHVFATCKSDTCTVTLYPQREQDRDAVRQEVERRLALVRPTWPADTAVPVVRAAGTARVPLLWLTLSDADGLLTVGQLSALVQREVRPRLASVPGVRGMQPVGLQPLRLRVYADPDRLAAFALTGSDVAAALQRYANEGRPGAGPRVVPPKAEDLANVVLREKEGRMVFLRDVATVEIAPDPSGGFASHAGRRCVVLGIQAGGAAPADAVRAILRKLPEARQALPESVRLEPAIIQPTGAPERGPVLVCEVRFPEGASRAERLKLLGPVEKVIAEQHGVADTVATLSDTDEDAGTARVVVQLAPDRQRKGTPVETALALARRLQMVEGVVCRLRPAALLDQPPTCRAPFTLTLTGPDLDTLMKTRRPLEERLRGSELVAEVWSSPAGPTTSATYLDVDRRKAVELGVTVRDIMDVLQTANGASRFVLPGLDLSCELVLGAGKAGTLKPEDLRALRLRTPQGEMVPLSALVRVQEVTAVGTILHCDGQRALLLEVDPAPGKADAFRKALRVLVSEALPVGVRARLWTDDPAKKPEDISAR